MRLPEQQRQFLKEKIHNIDPEAMIYLFGSRTDDQAKGGDIDILILSAERLPAQVLRKLRREFYKSFGWQKIDLINFRFTDKDPFKDLISTQMIPL